MSDERQHRFDDIYRCHYGHVLAYASRRLPPEPAADVVAETFTTAWRHIDRVPADGELPWLYRVASNAVATERRGIRRRTRLQAKITQQIDFAEQLSDHAEQLSDSDAILEALRRLPVPDQEALLLTSWEDLDTATAAHVAGCSVTAFKVRLHRARRRLAQLLALVDPPRPPATTSPHLVDAPSPEVTR